MPDRRLMPLSRWNITFFYHQKDGCKISQTCFCCQKHDIFSYSSVKNTHFYCLKDGWACPEVPLETTCLLLAENGCQQLSSGYLARTHVACNPPSLYGRNVDMMWVKQSSVCQWFAETFSRLTSALPGLKKKHHPQPGISLPLNQRWDVPLSSWISSRLTLHFPPEEWLQWDMCGYPD